MRIALVHTLGGGIISALDERLNWLNRSEGLINAHLIAPERRRVGERQGTFFPVKGALPGSYHPDYEQAVVGEVIPALRQAHEKFVFDAIDAHDGIALIAASVVCREAGIPLFHTIHSHEVIERLVEFRSLELREAIEHTRALIAVSQYIADEHRAVVAKPISVVANALPRGLLPRTRGLSSKGVRAVFVGRIEKAKGFDVLMDAVQLLGLRSDVTVTIAGSGEDDGLVSRAETLAPQVVLAGRIEGAELVHELIAQQDVFVFPSRKEACSMALLEAIGSGLAVIASDIPPNREMLADAALFHRDGDAVDLARCLSAVVESATLREDLALRAQQRSRYFAPSVVYGGLEGVYLAAR